MTRRSRAVPHNWLLALALLPLVGCGTTTAPAGGPAKPPKAPEQQGASSADSRYELTVDIVDAGGERDEAEKRKRALAMDHIDAIEAAAKRCWREQRLIRRHPTRVGFPAHIALVITDAGKVRLDGRRTLGVDWKQQLADCVLKRVAPKPFPKKLAWLTYGIHVYYSPRAERDKGDRSLEHDDLGDRELSGTPEKTPKKGAPERTPKKAAPGKQKGPLPSFR